jgi:hypothetical protein
MNGLGKAGSTLCKTFPTGVSSSLRIPGSTSDDRHYSLPMSPPPDSRIPCGICSVIKPNSIIAEINLGSRKSSGPQLFRCILTMVIRTTLESQKSKISKIGSRPVEKFEVKLAIRHTCAALQPYSLKPIIQRKQ